MIRLKKRMFKTPMVLTESFVGTGHWLVLRSSVHAKDEESLREDPSSWAPLHEKKRTDADANSLIPREGKRFKRTPVMSCGESGEDFVLFVAPDGEQWWANRCYVDDLDVQEVLARSGKSAGWNGAALVMPINEINYATAALLDTTPHD